jgi:hypothetical protein
MNRTEAQEQARYLALVFYCVHGMNKFIKERSGNNGSKET